MSGDWRRILWTVLATFCNHQVHRDFLVFFFFPALNFLQLKVLAFSTTSFHFPRSWTQAIQFCIFIWQMYCLVLSSHLCLGLPCDLLVRGFQLNIFLTVLVSGIICTWPNQLSLWALMRLIIFLCFISLSNSSLVLTLHIWFSFVGPNILLRIFLSKTNSYRIINYFNSHVSEA